MHGRQRPPKGFQPMASQLEKLQKKTDLLKNATTGVLTRIQDRSYDSTTLALSGKLLALNPEVYTVWNYRKDALTPLLADAATSDEEKRKLCRTELQCSAEALANNPKSYGAWYHRCWMVEHGPCDLQAEVEFVEGKLQEDSRNFHAWHYRKFLVKKLDRGPQLELEFSQNKIEQNFSNYSAWHHRIQCFEALYAPIAQIDFAELLKELPSAEQPSGESFVNLTTLELELEIVHSAFVTDPDDSSAWIYYRWLLAKLKLLESSDDCEIEALEEVLNAEVEFFRSELLIMDPDSKWILLTYATLLEVQSRGEDRPTEELTKLYDKLAEVDSMRRGFYQDLRDGKASILM